MKRTPVALRCVITAQAAEGASSRKLTFWDRRGFVFICSGIPAATLAVTNAVPLVGVALFQRHMEPWTIDGCCWLAQVSGFRDRANTIAGRTGISATRAIQAAYLYRPVLGHTASPLRNLDRQGPFFPGLDVSRYLQGRHSDGGMRGSVVVGRVSVNVSKCSRGHSLQCWFSVSGGTQYWVRSRPATEARAC